MKVTKLEGIKLLEELDFPTVKRLDVKKIIDGQINIEKGISVRLSPKDRTLRWNVYLPSIHNCTDKEKVKEFVQKYPHYEVLAHETVKPELIGSISRTGEESPVIIEIFKNFEQRKDGIVDNMMKIPFYGNRLWISHLEMVKKEKEDFYNFRKVIIHFKKFPFSNYDMEFVIQDGKVIFTDLTLPDAREYRIYMDSSGDREQR